MALATTIPRQVNIVKCALLSPNLVQRAGTAGDRDLLLNWGFDLLPYVQRIDLYESIFDNTISGSLLMYENLGLPEYLPIVGAEFVDIAFTIDSGMTTGPQNFRCLFRVVSMKDQAFPKHDFRLYTLNLATPAFVDSVSSRISRRFDNVSCHDAVRDILTNDLKITRPIITDEDTFGKVSIVMPLSTPLRAIHYFLMLAQTQKTPHESNFVFFETLAGFHFTSVRKLIQSAPKDDRALSTFEVNPAVSASVVDDKSVQQTILRAHQDQGFDLLFDIGSGMLRSRMIHFDILARKSIYSDAIKEDVDSTYTKSFDQTTHLDKWPVYPVNLDQTISKDVRLFTVPSNAWSSKSAYVKSNADEPEQLLHEAVVLRNRQFKELMHSQLLIDVPGQPDIRAGTVVWVNYPSTRPLEGGEDTNTNLPIVTDDNGTQYYSGRHLVTDVHHIIKLQNNSAEYRTNLKVVKDSLRSPMYGFDNPK